MQANGRRALCMVYDGITHGLDEDRHFDIDVILGLVEEDVVIEHNVEAAVLAGGEIG